MARSRWRRILVGDLTVLRLVRSVLFVYVAVGAFAWFGGEWLIFRPPPPSYGPGDGILLLPAEGGGRIAARYLETPGARLVVLLSHGNAEDLGHARGRMADLAGLGVSVLGYDYPGYGLSEGRATEAGANRAIEAAYRHLVEDRGVDPRRIVLYGQSVGGGPTMHLASRSPVGGVVLHAAFTSAFRVPFGVRLYPFDRFDNLSLVRDLEAPLLVLHGTEDEVIAPWHGERLHAEAGSASKRIERFPGAHHNDLLQVAGPRWRAVLREFLAGLQGP